VNLPIIDKIAGGIFILARHPIEPRPGYLPAEIVLCFVSHNHVTPFVTWERVTDDCPEESQRGARHHGRYFMTEDMGGAWEDYQDRVKQKGVKVA
jgi:hypothetical protein